MFTILHQALIIVFDVQHVIANIAEFHLELYVLSYCPFNIIFYSVFKVFMIVCPK